ncbi:MAG: DUF4286 family protein [Saprospiraceae bacterium]|jgi:hypothetical protein|nr:DUF4286 family protein [Saprospiraceae bacterium]MBP9208808.1 DUF4286 family protein [Saprospiraceae bacterium]MBV6472372.1 hypothetical protein [Saprospiraceae bacterium]
MVIYNVTIKIDRTVHEEWLAWMRSHHIPKVLATGIFYKCRISRLDDRDAESETYVVQYDAPGMESLNTYMARFAPALQQEHIQRYANRFVAIRTYLEVIEDLYPSTRSN